MDRIVMFFILCFVTVLFVNVKCFNIDGPSVWQVTTAIGHGEEPHWDPRTGILYFVNIPAGEVYAYHFHTELLKKITLNGNVSPVIPSRSDPNLLIVGVNRSVVAVEWDGKNTLGGQAVLTTVSKQFPGSRFNDGKADKQGRLWWGTIGPEKNLEVQPDQGVFYKITKRNFKHPAIARFPVTNSNGIAWNKANNKMYYIDTPTLKVVEFDYNDENGTISNTNRTVFDVNDHKDKITGLPDGMTIDEEDNLYIALFGGGAVVKVNPRTSELLNVIAIPSRDVTSAIFGGPNMDILFVTTSNINLVPEIRKQYPAAGALFVVKNLNAKGLPAFTTDIIESLPKRNLLENILNPDLFIRETNTKQKLIQARDTEPGTSLWDTLVNAFRGFF